MSKSKRLSFLARLRSVQGQIRFREGRVSETRGWVPASLLSACQDIARLQRLSCGQVELVGRGRQQQLRFSRDLPAPACQAIRNSWTPPPPGGGGGGARMAG